MVIDKYLLDFPLSVLQDDLRLPQPLLDSPQLLGDLSGLHTQPLTLAPGLAVAVVGARAQRRASALGGAEVGFKAGVFFGQAEDLLFLRHSAPQLLLQLRIELVQPLLGTLKLLQLMTQVPVLLGLLVQLSRHPGFKIGQFFLQTSLVLGGFLLLLDGRLQECFKFFDVLLASVLEFPLG